MISAINVVSDDFEAMHQISEQMPRENPNGHKENPAPVPTQCPVNSTPKRAKTGLYVRSTSGLRLRDEKVRRLVRRMRQCMPWLEDADEPAARAWAQIEVLADMAHTILRKIGITSNGGEPRRLLTDFRQLRQAQLAYARELGMTPAARMAIKANGSHAPLDLAAAMARGEIEDVPEAGDNSAGNGPR